MKLPLLILTLFGQAPLVDKYTLTLFQGEFVARAGNNSWRAPVVVPVPKPKPSVAYRRDQAYAVWDDRGLSVRRGTKLVVTKLAEIAVSPRVFPRDQILKNLELFKQKVRTKEASALSGSVRFGSRVYFLARWDDNKGKPWLEALIEVDLADPKPHTKLLGRFDGLSRATATLDDKLAIQKGKLTVLTHRDDSWGLSTYSIADSLFDYAPLGGKLIQFQGDHAFLERTNYGTTVGGWVDLSTGTRRNLCEVRGDTRFLDLSETTLLQSETDSGIVLRNLETGAERKLAKGSSVRQIGANLVIWTSFGGTPAEARLYSADRFEELARWIR